MGAAPQHGAHHPQERISERSVEQIVVVPMIEIFEEVVEVPQTNSTTDPPANCGMCQFGSTISHEYCPSRTHFLKEFCEHIVDVLVEVMTLFPHCHRDDSSLRV